MNRRVKNLQPLVERKATYGAVAKHFDLSLGTIQNAISNKIFPKDNFRASRNLEACPSEIEQWYGKVVNSTF